ncbi:unnamed protein product, partial [Rotaria socialis]
FTGNIYISDSLNYRVQKWIPGQSNGTTVAGGWGIGSALNKLGVSYGVSVDPQSNIYISDYSYHRVVVWTAGNTTIGRLVAGVTNAAGTGANYLYYPLGIYVDANKTIYIA